MDKNLIEVIKKLKKLISLIENSNIRISSAYLFGSYANKKYNEYSDIDLALVSSDFEGIRFKDKQRIGEFVLSVDSSIEPVTFRPEDFNDDNPLAYQIKKTGTLII